MQKAKNIIASFLNINESEIKENTLMDNTVIKGSIMIHRMYSELSSAGYGVINEKKIKTYSNFLNSHNKATDKNKVINVVQKEKTKIELQPTSNVTSIQVGIDIEDIINIPVATDYREHTFYSDNFSSKEISYCILKTNPRASFAGKFSLKEAIVKADNDYKSVAFSDIEILNDSLGKPTFEGFSLSISHTTNQAIAIAIKGSIAINTESSVQNVMTKDEIEAIIKSSIPEVENQKPNNKMNYLSFILSLIAIGTVVYQNL